MSKRTIGDYILRGFVSRDKATVDAVMKEAEAALALDAKNGNGNGEHDEPDGDEGKQAIIIHNHHNEGGNGTDDTDASGGDDDWKKAVDTQMKELRDGLAKLTDMMTTRAASKDEDKGDDDDDDKKESKDQDVPLPASAGEGAQTGIDPPSAEPDLMEADPALKMGPTMMGDAANRSRINQAMNNVIRDTKARAEVLSPGIKIGVLDGALGDDRMRQAGQRICDTRRKALVAAAGNERGMVAVGRHTADSIKTMSCDAVRMLFIDASDRMRQMNNAQNLPSPQFGDMRRAANSDLRSRIEGINKRNAEFWATQGGVGRRAG